MIGLTLVSELYHVRTRPETLRVDSLILKQWVRAWADYTVMRGSPDGICKTMSHLVGVELEKSFQEWCNT